MLYIKRYKYASSSGRGKSTWQLEQYSDGIGGDGMAQALRRFRLFPNEAETWGIYRVSDMRLMACSKNYDELKDKE